MRAVPLLITVLFIVGTVTALDCNAHYYLLNGTCLQCDISCYNCSGSATNCLSCQEGFYLSGNTCLPCNSSCLNCQSLLECNTCMPTFRLASQKCLPCGPNCDYCSASACSTCSAGYDIKSSCNTCVGGFYWNSDKTSCLMCGMGCSQCNHTQCVACRSNYEFRNGSCISKGMNSGSGGNEKEDNSQLRTLIILAGVFAGLFVAIMVAYGLYRSCWSSKRSKDSPSHQIGASSNVEIRLSKSDRINQDLMNSNCLICSNGECDLLFSCGHNYHNRCLSGRQCRLCKQDIKEAPLFLQDVLRGSQSASDASDLSSDFSRKDPYREAASSDSVMFQQSHVEVE